MGLVVWSSSGELARWPGIFLWSPSWISHLVGPPQCFLEEITFPALPCCSRRHFSFNARGDRQMFRKICRPIISPAWLLSEWPSTNPGKDLRGGHYATSICSWDGSHLWTLVPCQCSRGNYLPVEGWWAWAGLVEEDPKSFKFAAASVREEHQN